MTDFNRRSCGSYYEEMAAEYLQNRGHRILQKNFRCRMGEIDLISRVGREDTDFPELSWGERSQGESISREGSLATGMPDLVYPDTLVFTEVKFRASEVCGDAVSAVDRRKQSKIYRVAQFYMMKHHIPEDTHCRFDVIAFDGGQIHHYPNAFGGM